MRITVGHGNLVHSHRSEKGEGSRGLGGGVGRGWGSSGGGHVCSQKGGWWGLGMTGYSTRRSRGVGRLGAGGQCVLVAGGSLRAGNSGALSTFSTEAQRLWNGSRGRLPGPWIRPAPRTYETLPLGGKGSWVGGGWG